MSPGSLSLGKPSSGPYGRADPIRIIYIEDGPREKKVLAQEASIFMDFISAWDAGETVCFVNTV